jgi:uncharacterized membrane protein YphA (DoxX/SURF4 family)
MLGRMTSEPSNSSSPRWVKAALESPLTWICARLGLVCAYLLGGLTELFDFPSAVAEQAHFGLHPPELWAVVTIVVEIGGSTLILWGRLVWLAGGALAVLTLVGSLVAENSWTMQGHAKFVAFNGFLEHIGLMGGFALAALLVNERQRLEKQNRRETSI